MPSLPVEKYTGIYTDKSYGSAEIILNGDELILTLLPFLPEGFVTFFIDGDGSVKYFMIDLPNPDFHFHDHGFVKEDLKD